MSKVAVIISGCGHLDGAEIRESVLTLLYLDQNNIDFDIYAPNQAQHHVINHLNGTEMATSRNVLEEAARIARGRIAPLANLDPSKYAGVVMPGGYGAAKNLSGIAFGQPQVIADLVKVLTEFNAQNKPIAAICIAPAVLASALKKGTVTIGTDTGTAAAINSFGATHQNCQVTEICVDEANKLITTPAYMFDAKISDVATGIEKLIKKFASML
jgi:enhancing lycopene biosynthesis protein 2